MNFYRVSLRLAKFEACSTVHARTPVCVCIVFWWCAWFLTIRINMKTNCEENREKLIQSNRDQCNNNGDTILSPSCIKANEAVECEGWQSNPRINDNERMNGAVAKRLKNSVCVHGCHGHFATFRSQHCRDTFGDCGLPPPLNNRIEAQKSTLHGITHVQTHIYTDTHRNVCCTEQTEMKRQKKCDGQCVGGEKRRKFCVHVDSILQCNLLET